MIPSRSYLAGNGRTRLEIICNTYSGSASASLIYTSDSSEMSMEFETYHFSNVAYSFDESPITHTTWEKLWANPVELIDRLKSTRKFRIKVLETYNMTSFKEFPLEGSAKAFETFGGYCPPPPKPPSTVSDRDLRKLLDIGGRMAGMANACGETDALAFHNALRELLREEGATKEQIEGSDPIYWESLEEGKRNHRKTGVPCAEVLRIYRKQPAWRYEK